MEYRTAFYNASIITSFCFKRFSEAWDPITLVTLIDWPLARFNLSSGCFLNPPVFCFLQLVFHFLSVVGNMPFIPLCMRAFSKYSLSTYFVAGTVKSIGDDAAN